MDRSESHAEAYLKHLGLTPVVYEPDGNVPPDFCVSDGIAVEVRRLNQHYESPDGPRALERDLFPIADGMRSLLAKVETRSSGRSWFVVYHYRRPVALWRELKPQVERLLNQFVTEEPVEQERYRIGTSFSLRFHPASEPMDRRFVLGGFTDRDAGGWLLHELQRNLQICIAEKTRKARPYRHLYHTWWLLLIDQIGYARRGLEVDLRDAGVRFDHDWDRVILLNPLNHTQAVVLE
jgi:hypothetical protein